MRLFPRPATGIGYRRQAHPARQRPHPAFVLALALVFGAGIAVAQLDPAGATAALAADPAPSSLARGPEPTFRPVPWSESGAVPLAAPADRTPTSRTTPAAPPAAKLPSTRPLIQIPQSKPIVVPRRAKPLAAGSTAVFLGDSYTSGWLGAGIGANGWPRIVGAVRGWRVTNLAIAGTGFLNPGWTGQPIGSRVAAAIGRHPDVVVIAGGHNNSRWSDGSVAAAADRVIDRVRAGLPKATLVIVAPIWPTGSPPARCLHLRDHLRRKAAAIGAIFVDPLAEGWFAGSRHSMILSDGIHPSNAGHRYMAQRVLARLAGR